MTAGPPVVSLSRNDMLAGAAGESSGHARMVGNRRAVPRQPFTLHNDNGRARLLFTPESTRRPPGMIKLTVYKAAFCWRLQAPMSPGYISGVVRVEGAGGIREGAMAGGGH